MRDIKVGDIRKFKGEFGDIVGIVVDQGSGWVRIVNIYGEIETIERDQIRGISIVKLREEVRKGLVKYNDYKIKAELIASKVRDGTAEKDKLANEMRNQAIVIKDLQGVYSIAEVAYMLEEEFSKNKRLAGMKYKVYTSNMENRIILETRRIVSKGIIVQELKGRREWQGFSEFEIEREEYKKMMEKLGDADLKVPNTENGKEFRVLNKAYLDGDGVLLEYVHRIDIWINGKYLDKKSSVALRKYMFGEA